MPLDYALSDFSVVVVGLWGAARLWRMDKTLLAIGMVCFAIPAAIGTFRIVTQQIDELAALHAGSSALLGLAGVALLTLGHFAENRASFIRLFTLAGALGVSTLLFWAEAAIAPVTALLIVLGSLSYAVLAYRNVVGWLLPAGFALILVDTLVIRRAPWLSEAASWHAFHLLLALALAMIVTAVRTKPAGV